MKRLKKILRWIAISAAVLITALLLANAYFVWSTGTALEARLEELRRAGQPVQLSDLAGAPIPPEQNADTFLGRAAADLESLQKELLAIFPQSGYPDRALTAPETERMRKVFDAYPRVVPLLEQAAACSDYAPQIDVSLPPTKFLEPFMDRVSRHRMVARVLRARTAWLIGEQRFDEAVACSTLLLRLARLWNHEPLIIGYLVMIACRDVAIEGLNEALRAGQVTPASRQLLEVELARHESLEGLRLAMGSERAYSLESVVEFPNSRFWLTRGFTNNLQLGLIAAYDQVFARIDDPASRSGQFRPLALKRPVGLNPLQTLVNLLAPSLQATLDATSRSLARVRSLRVLNALQARGPSMSGSPPALDSLGLPPTATIDPFNGEPLRVKAPPEGWLVYSIGANRVDDGGVLDKGLDAGVGPRTWMETDGTTPHQEPTQKDGDQPASAPVR